MMMMFISLNIPVIFVISKPSMYSFVIKNCSRNWYALVILNIFLISGVKISGSYCECMLLLKARIIVYEL
jgi:hypothetical protein